MTLVLEIGRQQLDVTASGEPWDMIRDALIREVTFGGTTCPTEQVCRLMASFLQDRRSGLPHGGVHHLQGRESDFRHSIVFQKTSITLGTQELEVFLRMSLERLRLCCGIQCTDSLHPNGPRQRRKLFTAALQLLRFAIGIETVCCENEAQRGITCRFSGLKMDTF